jgi:hypothetical protein
MKPTIYVLFYFSDNSDWCYAEHLSTGEKGYVPIAYISHASQKLISQEYEKLFIFISNPILVSIC